MGATLKHLLTPESLPVPTRAEIEAHYGQQAPATLMPGLAAGAPQIEFCRIVAVPTSWVPYFMDVMTPVQAWRAMSQLVATLATEPMRDAAEYLIDWCAAVCV